MNHISPKVQASTLGAAVASLIIVLVTVIWPDALTETQVATVQGAVSVILTSVLGYLVTDPQRATAADSHFIDDDEGM